MTDVQTSPSETTFHPTAPAPKPRPAPPAKLTPAPMTQAEYDALPKEQQAKWLKPDPAGKQAAFDSVRKAITEALKRTDLTPQEHYDLNSPLQALGAHCGPKNTPGTVAQREQARKDAEREAAAKRATANPVYDGDGNRIA